MSDDDWGWDFGGPVIHNPDPNSQAAAHSVEPYAPKSRATVWRLIRDTDGGLACWQVEEITGGLHQSVSATINWLHNAGALVRVGKNKTPTGRAAYIYRATSRRDAQPERVAPVPQGPTSPLAAGAPTRPAVPSSEDSRYPCPAIGCPRNLSGIRALIGGYVEGKCWQHGKRVVKA